MRWFNGWEDLRERLLETLDLGIAAEFVPSEVMRRVRADPSFESLPILLATASSIDLTVMQRATGLLRKPYPREVLLAMIQQMLAGRVAAGSDPTGGPGGGAGRG